VRRTELGRSGVEVTELGFGAAPIGNLYAPLDDGTADGAMAAAWAAGIRTFDTAPHYGLGLSERRLGAFLRGRPRAERTLSTKVGRRLEAQDARGRSDPEHFAVPATHRRVWDFSRDGVRRSVEDSLARMGLDRVDVLLLHDAEEHFVAALREGFPALAELRAQGMVGAIGAGMHDTGKLTALVREADVDVVMLAGRYTLLDHRALDDLLPACAERGTSVLAAGVFNSGILAKPRPAVGARFDYRPASPELLARAHRIADVGERHGAALPQLAIAFALAHPVVAGVVLGMRSAEEVRQNVAAHAAQVAAPVWAELRSEGLLDERAPVP
jgi:D-threo-aldose 1-dehydrogenase